MPSFDITSKTDLAEVDNAVDGVMREIGTRYDFKGSIAKVERKENSLEIHADDNLKLKQVEELVKGYFVRRKLDPGALDWQDPERAGGNTVRQTVLIKQGIDRDLAKKIIKHLKDEKLKVQTSVQGDELRVTGKKRDDLQAAISAVKAMDIEQPLDYGNFRD
ncbi:YajQ family cyclic di-GMP-binding protein [Marinibaculum pumilum]|uniref:Nucleotide-binding protein ACFOGJ_13630 n=1 Tax=Marinibaculum pumilum TaxID=1766165 RepID=A0ABV7L0X0_9PROT